MNESSLYLGTPFAHAVDPRFVGEENDAARRAVLEQYDFRTIGDDEELQAITKFAAALCETETVLVSLVGGQEQHFIARTGLEALCTPRNQSFCQFAMLEPQVMVVPDATEDPKFADNPLVTGPPHIRFYAGAPLISEEGAPLGALCAIDPKPREALTPLQEEGLRVLATAVMRRLAARRRRGEIVASSEAAAAALAESERRFEVLADAIPQMAWSTDADGIPDYFNARWYEFTGTAHGDHFGPHWVDLLHPDDRERAFAAWQDAVARGDHYEVEYRLRNAAGDYRWTLARGLPVKDADGTIVRWFGSNTDIHETKLLMENQQLLSKELSHRIKNIFSVVSGLVTFSSRSNPELQGVARILTDRINALGRAHNYVRPVSGEPASETRLSDLLADLFAPYGTAERSRVHIEGDDLKIGEWAVTPLALAFHEIATNAMKYGSLSREEGDVLLSIREDDDRLSLCWKERGGPKVEAHDIGERGFGSDLLSMSIERQLKGSLDYDWQEDGLCVTISVPTGEIAA